MVKALRVTRALWVALTLVWLAMVVVLVSSAEAVVRYGFNGDAREWDAYVEDAIDAHATLARVPVHHSQQDLEPIDRLYGRALAAGIKLEIVVWGLDEVDPYAYAADAVRIAGRYPGAWVQLWNEPQLEKFGGFTADETVALVTPAAQAIHALYPKQKIIGPGVLTAGWRDWVSSVYSRLPEYVTLGLHLYPGPRRPLYILRKEIALWKEWLGRPVDVTELGMRQDIFRGRQARMSTKAFHALADAGARSIVFHSLAEGPGPNSHWENEGRLWAINSEGERTRLFRAFRRAWRER